jgi:pantothenate kinase
MTIAELAKLIRQRAKGQRRFITALAGPPGAGKSTLAAELVAALGAGAKAVPMDGFHFDDAVLTARGARARKGAPDTYDVSGFVHLLHRLRAEDDVAIPLFDRSLEISRAGADIVTADDRLLLVEGNYLLLQDAPWNQLAPLWDLTVFLDVPEPELERRLIARWHHFGLDGAEARRRAHDNDIPNARIVTRRSAPAEIVLSQP